MKTIYANIDAITNQLVSGCLIVSAIREYIIKTAGSSMLVKNPHDAATNRETRLGTRALFQLANVCLAAPSLISQRTLTQICFLSPFSEGIHMSHPHIYNICYLFCNSYCLSRKHNNSNTIPA